MATLVLRGVKGSELTYVELDANFTNLNAEVGGKQPAGTYATGTGTASGTNTGDQTTITGNAATATALSVGADRTKLDAITGTNTGDESLASIKTKLGITTLSGSNTGDQVLPVASAITPAPLGTAAVGVATTFARGDHVHLQPTLATLGAQAAGTYATGTGTASGTNTGDQTLPTLASLGAQAALVSNTNIKTINSVTVLGSGNIVTGDVATGGALGTPSSGTLTNCTKDGTNGVGYLNIPQVSQSVAYTLILADSGKHILHPSADTTARIFTIPANASVAYPIGTALTFVNQAGAGVLTIAIANDVMRLAGVGTTGSRTLAANGIATAIKVAATEWLISGSGLT